MKQDQRFYGRRRGRDLSTHDRDQLQQVIQSQAWPFVDIAAIMRDSPVDVMEIGFGRGEHLLAQAKAHPDKIFVGCEVFQEGVHHMWKQLQIHELHHVYLYPEDARWLWPTLPAHRIERLDVFYPDPWPKTRHHKRRIVNDAHLQQWHRLLKQGGALWVVTDHEDYAEHCREVFATASGWTKSPLPSQKDFHAITRYQAKAQREGRGRHDFFYRTT